MSEYKLPSEVNTEGELDEILSRPTPETVEALRRLEGDFVILGVGGKIGPTLARLVMRASVEADVIKRVIGVSRFSSPEVRESLGRVGVETIPCDLLDDEAMDALPEASNIIFMVGRKFGTEEDKPLTWAVNTYLPALVAGKFRDSRIVVFSTGNVYPLVPLSSGGATESTPLEPVGEYAQSCLGRERVFEYFSRRYGFKALFLRLNYAIDLRYGVLLDVAQNVFNSRPVDLQTGYVNVIWQGDVNNLAVQALNLCGNPPQALNVTGPETVSIRWLAEQFGRLFNKDPVFKDKEMETAFLSNASKCHSALGYPKVTLNQMIHWVAHWVSTAGPTWNKPTHFEVREGKF